MKTLVIALSLLSPAAWALTTTDQLSNHCSAEVLITQTSAPYYSAEVLGHYRFSGYPASAGFEASVKFIALGEGCEQIDKKYHLQLTGENKLAQVSIPAVNSENSMEAAKKFVGQKIKVSFTQNFLDVYNGKFLPLFPLVHDEILSFSGKLGEDTITWEEKTNSLAVYGVPNQSQQLEGEKLKLAQTIVNFDFQAVKLPGWDIPYVNLLTEIEPTAQQDKVSYLHILESLFLGLDPDHTGGTAFFEFEVGGSSGAPIAEEIIKLEAETKALSQAEVNNLVFQFPSFELAWSPNSCLPINELGMMQALVKWQNGSLSYEQKQGALQIAGAISDKQFYNPCLKNFITNAGLVAQASLTKAALEK